LEATLGLGISLVLLGRAYVYIYGLRLLPYTREEFSKLDSLPY